VIICGASSVGSGGSTGGASVAGTSVGGTSVEAGAGAGWEESSVDSAAFPQPATPISKVTRNSTFNIWTKKYN
jgi:hypothetical protein